MFSPVPAPWRSAAADTKNGNEPQKAQKRVLFCAFCFFIVPFVYFPRFMRIISGKFKSRRLKGTPPAGVRPTSDKLRETLFNVLGARLQGAIFLDACAGAGAIGIEAVSRGAESVYFVEQSRKACQIIRENLQALEIQEGFKIMEMDLIKALNDLDTRFDIAFVDPPYDREDLYERVLEMFASTPRLAANGVLILEHSKRMTLPEPSEKVANIHSLLQAAAEVEPEATRKTNFKWR